MLRRPSSTLFVDQGIPRAGAEGMLSTPRWAMADALAILDQHYENVDSYLCGAAGMASETLAQLRLRLLD
jgi:hypothetical protein